MDSISVKNNAILSIFKDQNKSKKNEIKEYLQHAVGINRTLKIGCILTDILHVKEADKRELLGRKLIMLSEVLNNTVENVKFNDCAVDFIEYYEKKMPLYIISAAPVSEIKGILGTELSSKVLNIYGDVKEKHVIIDKLLKTEKVSSSDTVFIGDTATDLKASTLSKVDFIGYVNGVSKMFPSDVKTIKSLCELINYKEIC